MYISILVSKPGVILTLIYIGDDTEKKIYSHPYLAYYIYKNCLIFRVVKTDKTTVILKQETYNVWYNDVITCMVLYPSLYPFCPV